VEHVILLIGPGDPATRPKQPTSSAVPTIASILSLGRSCEFVQAIASGPSPGFLNLRLTVSALAPVRAPTGLPSNNHNNNVSHSGRACHRGVRPGWVMQAGQWLRPI
jgi:hypothetical protein